MLLSLQITSTKNPAGDCEHIHQPHDTEYLNNSRISEGRSLAEQSFRKRSYTHIRFTQRLIRDA